jgi:hypothetical protein
MMLATARCRMGCKGFVACRRENPDKSEFHGCSKVLSTRPLLAKNTVVGSEKRIVNELSAAPPMRTLPEQSSLCDSERIKAVSLKPMDRVSSHSKIVHRTLFRHWNGATVKTNTGTIVAFIQG